MNVRPPRKRWKETRAKEPAPACPSCRATDPLPIVYGLLSGQNARRLALGEIEAGGLLDDVREAPGYRCRACRQAYGFAFSSRIRQGLISRYVR